MEVARTGVQPGSERQSRWLNFYGWVVQITWPKKFEFVGFHKEFQYFDFDVDEGAAIPSLVIQLELGPTQVSSFAFTRPSFATPRNVCYLIEGQRIINYHNEAIVIEKTSEALLRIVSLNPSLLESILYTVLIAKSGEYFDRIGRFRVHALSFVYKELAYLILLPMGGGKSTLLLHLLRNPDILLISEDTPLLDRQGQLWPFPVKIGVLPGKVPAEVPPEMIARISHLEGVEKEVIDLAYLGSRISTTAMPIAGIFVGLRYLGIGTSFTQLSYFRSLRVAIRDCVVGVGVFQGLEFMLSRSNWEILQKAGLGLRRLIACAAICRKAQTYEFQMGTDPEANAESLLGFISETRSTSDAG